jgi:O-antigen/teichoic acid export membrane protein
MEKIVILMVSAFIVFSIATALLIFEIMFGGGIEDYSVIIWNFAISIIVVIVIITIVMYRRRKKKKKEKKEKRGVVYLEAEGGEEYRTEYY